MNKVIILSGLAFLVVSHMLPGQTLKAGDQAPFFELPDPKGEVVSIETIDSKLIILDFWASWCRPCLKATRSTLQPLYKSYDRADVEIIGISNDRDKSKWLAAIDSWQLDWPNVWDEDRALVRGYAVPAIPTYFIVDNKGKILATNIYSNELPGRVRKLLKDMD